MPSSSDRILQAAQRTNDGWQNAFTMLGVRGRDKRLGAQITPHIITQPICEAIYQADDIGAKAVDLLPDEMMREGFKIIIPDDKKNLAEAIKTQWDRYLVSPKILNGMKWGNLYGGAALLLGLDDGLDPSEPVDLDRIRRIEYLTVLDKYRIFPAQIINYDVTSQNFGNPDYYRVYTMQTVLPMIHHSRIIRFNGVPVPWRLRARFNYWGDSVYGRTYPVIRDFQASHASLALTIQDFTQFIFKLQGLTALLAQGDKGDQKLAKRMELIGMTSSQINAVVIQEGEEAERKTTQVTGLAGLIQEVNKRLCSALSIPHTKLLGESPSGLGATGQSELIDWYDQVRGKQHTELQPIMMRLLEIFFAAKDGPTGGKIPDQYGVEFNPLWQDDEETASKIRLNQAQVDDLYIGNGTLTDEEVAMSRFGTGQYSTETQLNLIQRNAIQNAIAKGKALKMGPPPDPTEPWLDPASLRDPTLVISKPAPRLKKIRATTGAEQPKKQE